MENSNTILEGQLVPETQLPPQVPTVEEVKEQFDEDEKAAIFLNQSHKQFRRIAFGVARKKYSTARVLEAVLFEPFEDVSLQGKAEEELLALCRNILYAKEVVFKYAVKRNEELKKGETNEQTEK